jgi:RNA polymerase sigma-70 factor (ECF subfamily)
MRETQEQDFARSIEPYRGALKVHCYRMLGSSHDGEDMVQETMLRAWRSRETLKDRAMLRPWLYRIATNTCLDELKARPRRALTLEYGAASDPTRPPAPPIEEPLWLEPMPDRWIEGAGEIDPSAKYSLKESVALAFVAALQILTPAQRATLLLRDVVGLSAEETAEALGMSVSAANSALFRARSAVEEKLGGADPSSRARPVDDIDHGLLERYVRAFEESKVDELVRLLHVEVKTTMPPSPTWIDGLAANEVFFRTMWRSTDQTRPRIVRIRANGQIALAFNRARTEDGPHRLTAVQLVALKAGRVARIDHFMNPAVLPLFDIAQLRSPAP